MATKTKEIAALPEEFPWDRSDEFVQSLNNLFSAAIRGLPGEKEMLQNTLDAGLQAVRGRRGFIALVDHETGALEVACVAGKGWNEENRRMRLSLSNEQARGITGHVAITAQPYITGDVDRDPYYLKYFDDVKSEIAVPILAPQGQTRGVINIDGGEPNFFTSDDCAHLAALAHAAGVALTFEGFRTREAALVEIGNNLTSTLDVEALMEKVVDVAATVLKFEDCSVFLLDEQTDHLVLQASRGTIASGTSIYSLGEGLTGWVAQTGDPVRLRDPIADARALKLPEHISSLIGPLLAVPIVSRDKILGVLRVVRKKSHSPWFHNEFTEADERLLSTVASQLGAAIENARSFKQLVRAERMAAWGELSARSAHMIGNRTFALKGDLNELRFLMEGLANSPETQEVLALVKSMDGGIERLEEILREFRDYVVATQVTLVPTDINAIVKEVVSESFPKRCCVNLHLVLADGLPPVHIDSKRLKRAFSELIENSLSFQPDGGNITIRTRMVDSEDRKAYRLAHFREYVLLEFADDGPGVPEDIKQRIFRPFFTSRVKGMGLGLSIVKGIVEAHQGFIREAGVPGQGAMFHIYLPVENEIKQSQDRLENHVIELQTKET